MSSIEQVDSSELPWDPFWAYVLPSEDASDSVEVGEASRKIFCSEPVRDHYEERDDKPAARKNIPNNKRNQSPLRSRGIWHRGNSTKTVAQNGLDGENEERRAAYKVKRQNWGWKAKTPGKLETAQHTESHSIGLAVDTDIKTKESIVAQQKLASGRTLTSHSVEQNEPPGRMCFQRRDPKLIVKDENTKVSDNAIIGRGDGQKKMNSDATHSSSFVRNTCSKSGRTVDDKSAVRSEVVGDDVTAPLQGGAFSVFDTLLELWGVSSEGETSDFTVLDGDRSAETSPESSLVSSYVDEDSEYPADEKGDSNEVRLTFQPLVQAMSGILTRDNQDNYENKVSENSSIQSNTVSTESSESVYGPIPLPSLIGENYISKEHTELSVVSVEKEESCVPLPNFFRKDDVEFRDEESSTTNSYSHSRSHWSSRVVCCSVKNLAARELDNERENGLPYKELSREELEEMFPKLRTVVDKKAEVIGTCNSFEEHIPAHLQTNLAIRGRPQSLYEYEYESGENLFVSYDTFGPDAQNLLKIRGEEVSQTFCQGTCSVLLQVEASTVSLTDCFIRRGLWWRKDTVPLPNVPGVDAVGTIIRIDNESSKRYNISVGDRLLVLSKWGGNARYLVVDPSRAVKVPVSLDPAPVVCLPETYLSAFQVLHHGIPKSKRYRLNSLRGKSFLISGPMDHKFAQALSQLAKYAGAKYICASTNNEKRAGQLEQLGIVALYKDTGGEWNNLHGKIDMIISFDEEVSPLQYKLLTQDGEIVLVCCGDLKVEDDYFPSRFQQTGLFCRKSSSQRKSRTHTYDVYREWDEGFDRCKKDLEHLLFLLEKDIIQPNILDRIPLSKVARAQQMTETKRMHGFLVCEPWLKAKSRAVRL